MSERPIATGYGTYWILVGDHLIPALSVKRLNLDCGITLDFPSKKAAGSVPKGKLRRIPITLDGEQFYLLAAKRWRPESDLNPEEDEI